MKFIFELYRASSKAKDIPASKKLILNSNDNWHPQQKAKFVEKLKDLSSAAAIRQDGGKTQLVKKVTTRKGKTKTKFITQLVIPRYGKSKTCTATLTVFTPSNRKSDPDNLQPTMKAIMDGFTEAGLWPDDNHEVVKYTKYQYGGLSGTKAYRLEVDIEDLTFQL